MTARFQPGLVISKREFPCFRRAKRVREGGRAPALESRGTVRARGVVLGVALALWAGFAAGPARAGPQQAGVQVALRALGLYAGPVDGIVGPGTVHVVRAAQRRFGLPATGRIDARTRRALGPLGRPLLGTRTIHPGDFGLDVAAAQFVLAGLRLYRGALDGYLGARTERAVRRFQRRERLAVDGVVGPQTARALLRQPPPARTPLRSAAAVHADVRERLDLWAGRLGVPAALVRALAWMESGYQPQVESGVLYLRHLLRRFDGDERLALAAWYQGERAVRQAGVYPETRRFVDDVLALRARM